MVGRLGDPNAGRVTTSSITLQGNLLWQAVQEAFFLNPFKADAISDQVTFAEARAVQWAASTEVSDQVALSEPELTFYVTVLEAVADALVMAEANHTQPALAPLSLQDVASFGEDFYITRIYPQTLTQGVRVLTGQPFLSPSLLMQEAAQFGDAVARAWRWARQAQDGVGAADSLAVQSYLSTLVAEPLPLQDRLFTTFAAVAAETVALADPLTVVRALQVLETLGIAEAPLAKATLYLTAAERVRFLDTLLRFFSGDVVEALSIASSLSPQRRAMGSAAETVGVADSLTPRMVLRLTATDTVGIDPVQALKLLFSPTLAETVEIVGAYISPDGDLTTWAVNTRSGAVTEYTNYDFNSFARVGMRYLGASATGLYELDGDDDAGTDIIADLKGGFLQFNGSRFAGMKAVYLGVRGGGEFFLKLEAASGETYTYKVIAEDMETTKVWIGKGLRHRYLAYELISTGQDFDLESIEFVPMLAQRRV